MSKCPSCDSGFRKRITRNSYLRLLFRAKIYKCHECKVKYIRIPFLSTSIIIKKGITKNNCKKKS